MKSKNLEIFLLQIDKINNRKKILRK